MRRRPSREDRVFYFSLIPFAYLIVAALVLLVAVIVWESLPALREYGTSLYTTNKWIPLETEPGQYGILAAIYGTLASTLIALAVALPLSIALLLLTEELAPARVTSIITSLVDIAAGLPTIVFGLWGADILAPMLRDYVMKPLYENLGFIPLFSCRPLTGFSLLTAGVLLGIVIVPFMYALIREAYRMIPVSLREAALMVSAAWYQYVRLRLGMIKPAILASVLLGFGRAAGETVAVSLVVGNSFSISSCLFTPAYTVSSLIANQFGNAAYYPLMPQVLFASGLVLLVIGLVLNWAGVYLMDKVRSIASR